MYAARLWSVRHAPAFQRIYGFLEGYIQWLRPLVRAIGPRLAETAMRPIERVTKQFLFDCRMCGQCVLSSTGMACPMNCAKQMRNGPCGGVRPDGTCEVNPGVRCAWIEAIDGGKRIASNTKGLASVLPALPPLDHARTGESS